MEYLSYFKPSFNYFNKVFHKYSYEHYVGYKLKIKNVLEMEDMIADYRRCNWNIQISPPNIQIVSTSFKLRESEQIIHMSFLCCTSIFIFSHFSRG